MLAGPLQERLGAIPVQWTGAWSVLVIAVLVGRAHAVPLLPIVLPGDATTLRTGGTDGFQNAVPDTLRLVRPALLAEDPRALVDLRVASELGVDITGNHRFSGSHADELRTLASVRIPWRALTFAISGTFDDGQLVVQQQRDGELLAVSNHTRQLRLGIAAAPLPWLLIGASAGLDTRLTYALEALARIGPLDVGLVHRTEHLAWNVTMPQGPQRKVQRPELSWQVGDVTAAVLAIAQLRTNLVDAFFSVNLMKTDDLRAELAWHPIARVIVRAAWSGERLSFEDWAWSARQPVARVNLGIHTRRTTIAAELALGTHRVFARVATTDLATASAWADNGEVTAMRLFALQTDLELYLRHLYRARFEQQSVGWEWRGERFDAGAGAQLLSARSDAGGLVYGSEVSALWSGNDIVKPESLQLVGLTAGVGGTWGSLRLRVSAAQLLPAPDFSTKTATTPSKPPTKPSATPANPARVDGGRLVLFELTREL